MAAAQDITQNISRQQADRLLQALGRQCSPADEANSLLRLAAFNILKPGENKADLDSAASFLARAESLNEKLRSADIEGRIALAKAGLFREEGFLKPAKEAAVSAIRILQQTDDKRNLGLAYFERSEYFDYHDDRQIGEKIRFTELASTAFEASGDTQLMAFALKNLADLYVINDQTYKALHTILAALTSYQSIGYRDLQGVYCLAGWICYCQGDFIQALNYELTAVRTAEDRHDSTLQLCEIENYTGLIYNKLNQNAQAIPHFRHSLEIAAHCDDHADVILLLYNLCNDYIATGKAPDALRFLLHIPVRYLDTKDMAIRYLVPMTYLSVYTSLKKYADARPYGRQLLDIARLPATEIRVSNSIYLLLAKYYSVAGQYRLADEYLRKSAGMLSRINDPLKLANTYRLWFGLDTARRRFEAAARHITLYNSINDSFYRADKRRQLNQLASFYETEQKENELKMKDQRIGLLTQKNQLQQANLKHDELVKKVTIAVILLLALVILFLYRQYLQKRRSNRQTIHRNLLLQDLLTEKEWLIKEVHHRVKNNLHTVLCLLESQGAFLQNDALKAIENSQHRIYALSLIYQKLYQADDIRTIDMAAYLPEFIQYLREGFDNGRNVFFRLEVAPVKLPVSQAVPLALIINELVCNSLKYAFPDGKRGEIVVSLQQIARQVQLLVGDNGIGLPRGQLDPAAASLGLRLVHGLAQDISASVRVETVGGTQFAVTFEPESLENGPFGV